jgi:hypothetical protein
MTASRTFGRRVLPAPAPALQAAEPAPAVVARIVEQETPAQEPAHTPAPDIDEELRTFQRERLKSLPSRLPLRQISLMASLSFGIASFVLPDSVNDWAAWFLELLAAASALTWLSTWVRKTQGAVTSER